MELTLTQEEKILLSASRLDLSPAELVELNNSISGISDWKLFFENLRTSTSSPLIYKNFLKLPDKHKIPEQIRNYLKQRYTHVFFANSRKYHDLAVIVKALNENNIDFIPLKGIMLAEIIYKDIGLRPMADIDILVKKKDADKCRDLILMAGWHDRKENIKSGFIKNTIEHHHPYSFVSGTSILELHTGIHTSLDKYSVDISDFWNRAVPMRFLKGSAFNLSSTDLILHLCMHLSKHRDKVRFNLIHYCDIAEVIKKYKTGLDWQQLIDLSKKYTCENEVADALSICSKYLFSVPDENIIKQFRVSSKINYEFVFVNLFRKKKEEVDQYLGLESNPNLFLLSRVNGIRNKIHFLIDDVFPSLEFMVSRYNMKNKNLAYFYYPVRIAGAIRKLIKVI